MFLPVRPSLRYSADESVSPRASSSSLHASNPASEVIVTPRNSPAGEGLWPVILTYVPYRKDDQVPFWLGNHDRTGFRTSARKSGRPHEKRRLIDTSHARAYCDLIPVFVCGIDVIPDKDRDGLFAAHWRAHLITPHHQCLRCNGQYNTSQVQMELDGSLDAPTYVQNLDPEARLRNQNVFPFGLAVAGMTVNQMLRYLVAPGWWPATPQEHYQYMTGEVKVTDGRCHGGCQFPGREARGDEVAPPYMHWERDP